MNEEIKQFASNPGAYVGEKVLKYGTDPLNIGFKTIQKPLIMDALQDVPFGDEELAAINHGGADPFDVARMMYEDNAKAQIQQGGDAKEIQQQLDGKISDLNYRRVFIAKDMGELVSQTAGSTLGGLGEGVQNFTNDLELTARTMFQSREQVNAARQNMQRDPDRYANQIPIANKVGQVVGELYANFKGMSPVIGTVNKFIKPKAINSIVQLLTGGATTAFIQDPGDVPTPLRDKSVQAAYGAGFSAILGGPLAVIPPILKWSSTGLLQNDVQNSIKQYLAQLPLFGSRKEIRQQATILKSDIENFKNKVFSNGVPENIATAETSAYAPINEAIGEIRFFTGSVIKNLKDRAIQFGKLSASKGGDYNKQVEKLLNEYADDLELAPSWSQLRTTSTTAGKTAYKNGVMIDPPVLKKANQIRKQALEDFLEEQAHALGQGDNYQKAKILTQELAGYKQIAKSFDDSITNETYGNLDASKFVKSLEKKLDKLKESGDVTHPLARAEIRQTLEGIKKYIDMLPYAAKYLKSSTFPSIHPMSVGATGATALAFETVIGTLTGNIAKILTSPTMIRQLQNMSKMNAVAQKDAVIKLTSVLMGRTGGVAGQVTNTTNQEPQ